MKGIGILMFFTIIVILNIFTCKEKGKETKSIPLEFQGIFVETTEATALGGKSPIKIRVDGNSIAVSDPEQNEPTTYPINKVVKYENHIDFYYPDKYQDLCVRVYYRDGLFYFYDAELLEEGLSELKIGVFSKTL